MRSVQVNPSRQLKWGSLDQTIIPKLPKACNMETVDQKRGKHNFRVKLAIVHEAIKEVMSEYSETEQERRVGRQSNRLG